MQLQLEILVGGLVAMGVFTANTAAGFACMFVMYAQGFDTDFFTIDALVFLVVGLIINLVKDKE